MRETKEEMMSAVYNLIADEISLSNTMRERAIEGYNAVGNWLGECEPGLDVHIEPQGSLGIGTTTKPISDKDEYDIDLVCLLKNGYYLDEYSIKNIVGNRLKEHKTYCNMLDSKEGKRCWTLNYSEFHMDILPSVPMENIYIEPDHTAIRLTHKNEQNQYEPRYSNPSAYRKWFFEQMEISYEEEKRNFAYRNKVEIETVESFQVKTPLQKAVQLLKRHRDIMFDKSKTDDAPISIIITTLAATAYNNELDLYSAIFIILNNMGNYIQKDFYGRYVISNPVLTEENYAEKWNKNAEKAKAFYLWLRQAKIDLLETPQKLQMPELGVHLKNVLGEAPVNRSFNKLGSDIYETRKKGELGVASTGIVATTTAAQTNVMAKVPEHTFYGQ